ncbi:MAG: GNVR domain-containing protein, partial [Steroidobacteraceae bacterium]
RGAAAQHQREIRELRRFVDSAPEVEQEYARLNRDYGVTKAQYEQLVARLEQAKVTDDAAKNGIVRFEVIEPPRADLAPVWPRRALLMLFGLVVGVGAGVGLAILPSLFRPTFNNPDALAKATQLPVLGSVSALRRPQEVAALPVEIRKMVVVAGALLGAAVVLVLFGSSISRAFRSLIT